MPQDPPPFATQLGYAPGVDRSFVRPVLWMILAMPATSVVSGGIQLFFAMLSQLPGPRTSVVFNQFSPLMLGITAIQLAAGVAVIVTAWNALRGGPINAVRWSCLVMTIVGGTVLIILAGLRWWSMRTSQSLPPLYAIQLLVQQVGTAIASAVLPLTAYLVLGKIQTPR